MQDSSLFSCEKLVSPFLTCDLDPIYLKSMTAVEKTSFLGKVNNRIISDRASSYPITVACDSKRNSLCTVLTNKGTKQLNQTTDKDYYENTELWTLAKS